MDYHPLKRWILGLIQIGQFFELGWNWTDLILSRPRQLLTILVYSNLN